MKCAIMQPTYLPWAGYFALMTAVDVFILLDDVEFSHQSWQQRNRIKAQNGPQWLTVPVKLAGKKHQLIRDVEIDDNQPWRRRHSHAILQGYARAAHLAENRDWIESLYQQPTHSLCEWNIRFIGDVARILGLKTDVRRSSNIPKNDERSARLVDCCRAVGADEYLSPPGSFEYLDTDRSFDNTGITLSYLHYEHPVYDQLHGGFVSHLSVLDLLLNKGPASAAIIESGLRPAYSHEQLRAVRAQQPGDGSMPTGANDEKH